MSRTHEYDADLNAAHLTGDPEGLTRALVEIERLQGSWLEHLFLPGPRLPEPFVVRTHPPTDKRVRRLMELKLPDETHYVLLQPDVASLAKVLRGNTIRRAPPCHIGGL